LSGANHLLGGAGDCPRPSCLVGEERRFKLGGIVAFVEEGGAMLPRRAAVLRLSDDRSVHARGWQGRRSEWRRRKSLGRARGQTCPLDGLGAWRSQGSVGQGVPAAGVVSYRQPGGFGDDAAGERRAGSTDARGGECRGDIRPVGERPPMAAVTYVVQALSCCKRRRC